MTKIIGHRGARGVELENSIASIRAALALDLDAVEFDVHRTSDGKLVVIHDNTTRRVADRNVLIRDTTLKELQELKLKNGQHIPTLDEVLELARSRPIFLDIKDENSVEPLAHILKNHKNAQITFVSSRSAELREIRKLIPYAPICLYFLKAKMIIPRPFKMVSMAKRIPADGIEVDKFLMNPITYHLAVKAGLEIYCYPFNSVLIAKLYKFLYPEINLFTGKPEPFIKVFKKQP